MPPRRIGFDAIRALRNTTGLGNYSRGVLRGIHQHDAAVGMHLYAPDGGRAEFAGLAAELDGTLHLPPEGSGALARRWWRTFRMGRAAAHDRIDLFHGLSHEIPRDLPATGIPSVVSFADLIYEKFPGYFPAVDRWSYRWRYRWSARHATAVVAISGETRDDLVSWYGIDRERIAVVPPARNPAFAVPATAAERSEVRARYGIPSEYLLSVGTLEPRKNQRLLLAALALMPPGDRLPLVLAGRDGGTLASLRREIASRRLADRVILLTDVTTDDMPALMQGATIFLYPSLVEGFGMPIVEALSAGTPVLATAGGCFSDAGGPTSRYAAADDPAAWATAIEELVTDSATIERMREAGRSWAAQFDGALLGARLTAVYEAVLAGQPLPGNSSERVH